MSDSHRASSLPNVRLTVAATTLRASATADFQFAEERTMNHWKKSCHTGLLMALALLLALPTASMAQARGQFSGTVVDQTGAVVGGATLTATSERTGDVRTTVTDAEGRFVITGLIPSTYTLKASFGQF